MQNSVQNCTFKLNRGLLECNCCHMSVAHHTFQQSFPHQSSNASPSSSQSCSVFPGHPAWLVTGLGLARENFTWAPDSGRRPPRPRHDWMLPPAQLTASPLWSLYSRFLEPCLEYRSSSWRPLLLSDAPMSSCTILSDVTILAILLRET